MSFTDLNGNELMPQRTTTRSRLGLVATFSMLLVCALASGSAAAKTFNVFYYDSHGVLLQVESLAEEDLGNRQLVDIAASRVQVPMLNSMSIPLKTGNNLQMSRFAAFAVYYSHDGNRQIGDQFVIAKPIKVEYLEFVANRLLAKCIGIDDSHPCAYPRRCHCPVPRCCCY